MPYTEDRIIHDADAHVMETPDWLEPFADAALREKLPPIAVASTRPGEDSLIESCRRQHADPAFRAQDEAELMLRKNWNATGSFIKEDRPRALDLLGFQSQLVFNTFLNSALLAAERGDDVDYGWPSKYLGVAQSTRSHLGLLGRWHHHSTSQLNLRRRRSYPLPLDD